MYNSPHFCESLNLDIFRVRFMKERAKEREKERKKK